MVTSGSKSASTTSSRRRRYNPGIEFQYQFDANRTFSSHGTRPVSCPARLKHSGSGSRKKANRYPFPADVIAMAQSPFSDFQQETIGSSLMLLQQGYRKVNPAKFYDLEKASNIPSPGPLPTPRSEISSPRVAKKIAAHIHGTEEMQLGYARASKATQYDYRSREDDQPSTASKRPSTVADVVASYIKQDLPRSKSSDIWSSSRDRSSQRSYSQRDEFFERCVRCSEFPDIQIEGRSLGRILTNKNTLMAKEHCEILGPDSCPDCVKTRSQKIHEQHCSKNTPAISTDVYKLALVHEKAPYLSVREVQRKILDGEISDKVFTVSQWPQSINSPAILNQDESLENPISLTGDVPPLKSSKSFIKSHTSAFDTFETIHEISETPTDSEEEEEEVAEEKQSNELSESVPEITFQRHDTETTQKICVVSPQERLTSAEIRETLVQEGILNKNSETENHNISAGNSIVLAEPGKALQSLTKFPSNSSTNEPPLHFFTRNVVPSQNFFFDIADLSERIRTANLSDNLQQIVNQKRKTEANAIPKVLSDRTSSPNANHDENKEETNSADSSDSMPSIKEFNMAYEPPILYENKGRYLGVKAPRAGKTASEARLAV